MTGDLARRFGRCRRVQLVGPGSTFIALLLALSLGDARRVRAQSQAATNAPVPSFEVASIKPDHSGTPNRFFRMADPSRLTITNMPVKDLIEFAYHVQPFQVSGGPGWINSRGYDIEAKVDDSVVAQLQRLSPQERSDQFRLMLQSLLTDRFKLKLGHETKEFPIYNLVVAKGGSKLTVTTVPATPPPTAGAGANGQSRRRGPMLMMSPGRVTGKAVDMSDLAEVLGRNPALEGRLVMDQTGLKGKYDFTLEFAPEREMPLPGTNDRPPMPAGADAPPPPDPNAPSIFTAIQEQLGLKLEPAKGAVQTLVIENIAQPSEN